MTKIQYGSHYVVGLGVVYHTDFWWEYGYCRWSDGHLPAETCLARAEGKRW